MSELLSEQEKFETVAYDRVLKVGGRAFRRSPEKVKRERNEYRQPPDAPSGRAVRSAQLSPGRRRPEPGPTSPARLSPAWQAGPAFRPLRLPIRHGRRRPHPASGPTADRAASWAGAGRVGTETERMADPVTVRGSAVYGASCVGHGLQMTQPSGWLRDVRVLVSPRSCLFRSQPVV
jgi:hypothetical protein